MYQRALKSNFQTKKISQEEMSFSQVVISLVVLCGVISLVSSTCFRDLFKKGKYLSNFPHCFSVADFLKSYLYPGIMLRDI